MIRLVFTLLLSPGLSGTVLAQATGDGGTARMTELRAALARAASGAVDEDAAEDLGNDALAIEAEQARLLERTQGRMNRALPPSKALKYLSLELKLAALASYEAAAALP